jgi:hypothetical protein
MFIIQRHFEDDNGKDLVWIFENKENALGKFQEMLDDYEKVCGNKANVDSYTIGNKQYTTASFENANETYTQFSLEEIGFSD